jgi:hypothetical protein
VDLEL